MAFLSPRTGTAIFTRLRTSTGAKYGENGKPVIKYGGSYARYGRQTTPQKVYEQSLHYSKGDDITTKKPVRHTYSQLLVDKLVSEMTTKIYFSSTLPPPSRLDHTVQKLCNITWAQTIDIETLPTWTNPLGKVYRKLKYDIEMICDQGTVDFAIYFRGRHVGGRNVQVDFY